MKRPKHFLGIWTDQNAYFPHLDGASVMTFEAHDLADGIRLEPTALMALAWVVFVSRHTDCESVIEPASN
jgi:hypothetical protein